MNREMAVIILALSALVAQSQSAHATKKSSSALAEGAKPQPNTQKTTLAPTAKSDDRTGARAADLLNVTQFNPDSAPSKSGIQVTVGCTDANGNSLKPEDPAYNQCLTNAQKQSAPGSHDTQSTPSVGFKFEW